MISLGFSRAKTSKGESLSRETERERENVARHPPPVYEPFIERDGLGELRVSADE